MTDQHAHAVYALGRLCVPKGIMGHYDEVMTCAGGVGTRTE